MLNKIQKYLLLHHPLIWNIRLVPMILILLATNFIFFVIGYFSTDVSFTETYYNSIMGQYEILYFVCLLVGILLLIGWLLLFNRNNAFKVFYPRKSIQLYGEWLLIFIIVAGISLIPMSLVFGSCTRWTSIASSVETEQIVRDLKKMRMLITSNENYSYNSRWFYPLPVDEKLDPKNISYDSYMMDWEPNGQIKINGYVGTSLLFYSTYSTHYKYNNQIIGIDKFSEVNSDLRLTDLLLQSHNDVMEVKNWLKNGDKEKILQLMDKYYSLQEKHNLKNNLDRDNWYKLINNPPYFAVDESNYIRGNNPANYDNYLYERDRNNDSLEKPFLNYQELIGGYEHIKKVYDDISNFRKLTLICLSITLVLSVFIFSFRISNGRSWLVALISSGVLLFTSIVLTVFFSQIGDGDAALFLFLLFWIAIFIISLIHIISRVRSDGFKGKSSVVVNIFLWLLPALIPLCYFGYAFFEEMGGHFPFDDKIIEIMFWANLLFSILFMYPVSKLIYKWKSIPEE